VQANGAKTTSVHLEILLAVADLWDSDELADSTQLSPEDDQVTNQVFLALSKAANGGGGAPAVRTVQFEGSVCGQPVLVLIDSGSSASFISKTVAAKLSDVPLKPLSSSVQVAGGGILCSEGILQQVPWSIGPCSFVSDFRVLELQSYDVIIDMD